MKRIGQVLQRNLANFAYNPSKEICTFLVFLITHQVIQRFAKSFAYLEWHGQGRFLIIFFTRLFSKKSIIANLQFLFAVSKSKALELPNDASFVIFKHQTCDLEGGGGSKTMHVAYT